MSFVVNMVFVLRSAQRASCLAFHVRRPYAAPAPCVKDSAVSGGRCVDNTLSTRIGPAADEEHMVKVGTCCK